MNKRPQISIIIAAYNEQRHIDECLISIQKQSYKNWECIVVDDGSTDKTKQIIAKYPYILISQRHQGPGIARNKGVQIAKGQILAFLDADMVYDKDYLYWMFRTTQKDNTLGAFNIEYIQNVDNIWSKCWSINSDLQPGQRTANLRKKRQNIYRMIYKKDFLRVGGFDPNKGYTDDTTLSSKLQKMATLAKNAIAYHNNPDTLGEVFYSARWIARSTLYPYTLQNLLRFSIINSFRNGIKKVIQGAPIEYIVFKIVFDFGSLCGLFSKTNNNMK